ncbi:MAG: HAMP domain-containing sensor histidine kinase [Coriobacteriaceae bacterium]|nr:HAMP domain-containing sensor histidine kinase [Coriobacteriaceae bacterium]
MPTGALIALALLLGIAAGLVLGVALYALELRRLTQNLRGRDAASNARLSLNARPPELPALVDAINGELDRSAQTSIDMQRHQQEFQRDLSALSHDIRTPLAGAKGYLQLALEESDSELRQVRLNTAIERIDRTSELLDALFSYTKASDPDLTLEFQPVDVREIVERCLLGHYPQFEERGWEPSIEDAGTPVVIDADAQALGRIVENLVANALRHGSGAPYIRIGARHGDGAGPGDPRLRRALGVSESIGGVAGTANPHLHRARAEHRASASSAPGTDAQGKNSTASASPNPARTILAISNPVEQPEAIEPDHLFDRFYQVDSARQKAGSGLGLATASKLARAMGLELQARVEGTWLVIELVTHPGGA